MLSIHFLLDLAIILLSTKILGIASKKVNMPQVVGALLAGVILGPCVLNIVHETDFISKVAELGVIVLMFNAGLETDLKELKKCGGASLIIALIGVIVPLLGGYIIAAIFNNPSNIFDLHSPHFLENVFIGVVLTATSVSITVETLQELGRLKTNSGTAILGAAIIDDILGIVILTIVTSSRDTSVSLQIVLIKIVLFFIIAIIIGIIFYKIFNYLSIHHGEKRRLAIYAFSFCLIMAFVAEHFFGVADITGAYIAGVIISNTVHCEYIGKRVDGISFMLLSPIFFASIGISTTITTMNSKIILFTITLLIVAILTKVIGCYQGAKLCKYTNSESLRIGVGMISRGEVALIVANKGAKLGLLNVAYFGPIILVVIVTTLITPILLKFAYSEFFGDIKEYNAALESSNTDCDTITTPQPAYIEAN
jgi:Na+:H+ antiporter